MSITFGQTNAYTSDQLLKTAEQLVAPTTPTTNNEIFTSYEEVPSTGLAPLGQTTALTSPNTSTQTKKGSRLSIGKLMGTAFRAVVSYPFAKMATSFLRGVSGAKYLQLGEKKIPLNFSFTQYLAALMGLKAVNAMSESQATALNYQA